ncbi:MAG TPA: class I SAM-dependent methyltransferase [Humisphaera sp.]
MTTITAQLPTTTPAAAPPPVTLRKWVRRRVRRLQYIWAERQLRRHGLLAPFAGRPADAFKPDYADLWYLYKLVRSRRPECVLEFGAGCSTVVLAAALRDNHAAAGAGAAAGRIVSVDGQARWAELAAANLPADLRPYARVSHVPALECEAAGTPGFRYDPAGLGDVVPDLIYLDGPELTHHRKVTANPLDLEPVLKPGCLIVVDGRLDAQAFLKKNLKRRWRHKVNGLLVNAEFHLLE